VSELVEYLFNELMSSSYGRSSKTMHQQAGYRDGGSLMPDAGSGQVESICPECHAILISKGIVGFYDALKGGALALEGTATRQYLASINLGDILGAEAKVVSSVLTGRASIDVLSMETRAVAATWYRAIASQVGGTYAEAAAAYNVARAEFLLGTRASLPRTLRDFMNGSRP
jgi:hypothetical protein